MVPAESEAEYLKRWKETTEIFRRKPGFIETHLHRNTGVGNTSFQYINIARWTSAAAWRSTHEEYQPGEYDVPGVKGHPAIFETVINVYSESLASDDRLAHWIASTPPASFAV